ncbi:MAG: site-specific DNA-methyltransferase [Anaerolineae bacterium]|nr:site-specific DNA-methyltransferase [Anaerolineae bacterium]
MRDVWDIPALRGNQAEATGYPTQKPLALYERIISASSNPGDMVLDPFCGSGTTAVAAERLGRRWLMMEQWDGAYAMLVKRLAAEGLSRDVVVMTL